MDSIMKWENEYLYMKCLLNHDDETSIVIWECHTIINEIEIVFMLFLNLIDDTRHDSAWH